ncbi:MAG: repressor LexA [Deltaproteobacteria bacterium]|nr:repressor LexA [Deltaproteobacteria bacterium]
MNEKLTPRQQEVLDFISDFITTNGYPPSIREIAAHLKVTGTLGVMKHLDALESKGYLRREAGSSRGIVLSGRTQAVATLPVVGVVRAGMPQPAIEDIEEHFAIDKSVVRGGTFFLRVKGDSMINAAITDGDLALVRPQDTAENRDIVVAMIDGEATLKRYYRGSDHIRLQPENPNMAPIIIRKGEGEVTIIGKVVGIYRPLE